MDVQNVIIPAQAGIQTRPTQLKKMDSRFLDDHHWGLPATFWGILGIGFFSVDHFFGLYVSRSAPAALRSALSAPRLSGESWNLY
jgi:hypothetical protein